MDRFITLNNGLKMPRLGLGTFKSLDGDEAYNAALNAINAGYLMIDTAQVYGNEESIGRAIKDSKVDRNNIFITTKLFPSKLGYKSAKEELNISLEKLGLDYVDLYLLHWPSSNYELNNHAWHAMEEIYESGKAKSIGVSNFNIHHLMFLLPNCKIKPMMNQIEIHPGLTQYELVRYCQNNNIAVTSYGPFMKGQVFQMESLKDLASKYNKSIPNIIVRWGLQRNIVMIPKSVTKERIIDNFNVFDFELTNEDMKIVDLCNRGTRVYTDPNNAHFVPTEE